MGSQGSPVTKLLSTCTCDCEGCETCTICQGCENGSSTSVIFNEDVAPPTSRELACALMLLSMLFYSGNYVVCRYFYSEGGSGERFLFLRSVVSSIFLVIMRLFSDGRRGFLERNDFSDWPRRSRSIYMVMLAGSLFGAIRQSVLPLALEFFEASSAGIIAPTIPLVAAFLSQLFGLEKLTKLTACCFLCSSLGMGIALDVWNVAEAGRPPIWLLIIVPIAKSMQMICLRVASEDFDGEELMRHQIGMYIVICLPASLIVAIYRSESLETAIASLFSVTDKQLLCVLYSVFTILYLSWRIQIYALKELGTNHVALFQATQTLFTMILGFLFLGESITLRMIVGSAMICTALYIYQKHKLA